MERKQKDSKSTLKPDLELLLSKLGDWDFNTPVLYLEKKLRDKLFYAFIFISQKKHTQKLHFISILINCVTCLQFIFYFVQYFEISESVVLT